MISKHYTLSLSVHLILGIRKSFIKNSNSAMEKLPGVRKQCVCITAGCQLSLIHDYSNQYAYICRSICRSIGCKNIGKTIYGCRLCNKYSIRSDFPRQHHNSVQHTKALMELNAQDNSASDDQIMIGSDDDDGSNLSVDPSSDSVSIESCSTSNDFPSILLMDDVMITEDVHYFSNPVFVAAEEVDDMSPTNTVDAAATIPETTIHTHTHSPSSTHHHNDSSHNTEQDFLDSIAGPTTTIIPGTNDDQVAEVYRLCIPGADATTRSYYASVMWSMAGQQVVETAHAGGAAEDYCRVTLEKEDCLFHLLLSKITTDLTPSQNEILLSLLQHARFRGKEIDLPDGTSSLTRIHSGGKYSISKNLHGPKPYKMPDSEFSYLSHEDIIRHACLTSRYPHPFLPFNNGAHANSERGKDLLPEHVLQAEVNDDGIPYYHVKTILWTDAFNPLNTKDSSLHLCVATIGALDGDHSGKRGYSIWLGPAKEDTDAVERRLVRELNHLSLGLTRDEKPFYVYHKRLNRIVHVKVHPFVILCDQPDTAARTKTSSGGRYHLQFGTSMDFFAVGEKVPCCPRCYQRILKPSFKDFDDLKQCRRCFSFDATRMKYNLPTGYPEAQLFKLGHPSEINNVIELEARPVKTKILIWACRYAFDRISTITEDEDGQRWTDTTADVFLQTFCVNKRFRTSLIINANNKKDYILARQGDKLSLEGRRRLDRAMEDRPHDYRMPPFPAFWYLLRSDINIFVAAIAHEVFEGNVKFVSEAMVLEKYVTLMGRERTFLHILEHKLQLLGNLKLPYMNVPSKTGKGDSDFTFKGLQCKEWLSIGRLSKWLFAQALFCEPEDFDHTYSKAGQKHGLSSFTASDQEKWCRRRGISVRGMPKYNRNTNSIARKIWFDDLLNTPSKMFDHFAAEDIIDVAREWHSEFYEKNLEGITDSKVIRDLFYAYIDQKKSEPLECNRVYPPDRFFYALDKVENSDISEIVSLNLCLISRIMGSEACERVDEIKKFIMLYLTKVHRFDLKCSPSTDNNRPTKPSLFSRPNLLSMLNLPDEIKRFGHLRLLWVRVNLLFFQRYISYVSLHFALTLFLIFINYIKEMGGMGEGFIPRIKAMIHRLKENFSLHAINNFVAEMAFSDLADELVQGLSDNPTTSVRNMCSAARDHIVIKSDDEANYCFAGQSCNSEDSSGNNIPFGFDGSMLDHEDNPVYRCEKVLFDKIVYLECEVMACVVHKPTSRIFVMVGKRKHTKKVGANHRLFEITLDITNAESMVTHMDAFYFKLKEVSQLGITVGVGHCPKISVASTNSNQVLYKKDMVCGFLMRHDNPRDHYYVTTMDWKELCIDQNNPGGDIGFYYPTTDSILVEAATNFDND